MTVYTIGEPVVKRHVRLDSSTLTTINAHHRPMPGGVDLIYRPECYAYKWSFATEWQVADGDKFYGPYPNQEQAVAALRGVLDGDLA